MEISFIIPVYNGEHTILRCIQSIQKWKVPLKIEILIINDGSLDTTGTICEEAAALDGRIRVFEMPNGGQSLARNLGMEKAAGRYLCFVDADDWVDTEQIYRMWQKAEDTGADVVMGSYVRVNTGKRERISLPGEGFIRRDGTKQEQWLYHRVKTESGFGYVWNKLYRKAFLEQHALRMDDIRKIYMEDQLFNLKLWSCHPNWFCMEAPLYYYDISNASTTRKAEPNIHIKNIAMLRELINYLQENHVLEDNLDTVVPLIMRAFCWSLVKNVAYEGKSADKIRIRAESFICDPYIWQVLQIRGAARSLTRLPSVLQTVFYFICLLLMKGKMAGLITVLFSCFYPLMNRYIMSTLK